MDDGGDNPRPDIEQVKALIEDLVFDGFLDGTVRSLLGRYPSASYTMAEDALAFAVETLLRRAGSLSGENLPGYLVRVAQNRLSRLLAERSRLGGESDSELQVSEDGSTEWTHTSAPDVVQEEFYKSLMDLVSRWPTETQRLAAELRLQAAWEGVPLSDYELADAMEATLDRSISRADAAQHWRRAKNRLAREIADQFEDNPQGD